MKYQASYNWGASPRMAFSHREVASCCIPIPMMLAPWFSMDNPCNIIVLHTKQNKLHGFLSFLRLNRLVFFFPYLLFRGYLKKGDGDRPPMGFHPIMASFFFMAMLQINVRKVATSRCWWQYLTACDFWNWFNGFPPNWSYKPSCCSGIYPPAPLIPCGCWQGMGNSPAFMLQSYNAGFNQRAAKNIYKYIYMYIYSDHPSLFSENHIKPLKIPQGNTFWKKCHGELPFFSETSEMHFGQL